MPKMVVRATEKYFLHWSQIVFANNFIPVGLDNLCLFGFLLYQKKLYLTNNAAVFYHV